MHRFIVRLLVAACFAVLFGSVASATSTDGYHKIVVLPLVVSSNTYTSAIYIHNPSSSTAINVHTTFYQGVGYAGVDPAAVTPIDCGTQAVGAGLVRSFASLAAICPGAPTPTPTSSVFGWLRTEEVTPASTLTYAIFTRVDNVQRTNGFEVEGFPAHVFTGADSYVVGLTRTGGGQVLKTNCFVSALNEATTVNLTMVNGNNGVTLAGPIAINLPANTMVRLLDIFGANIGDYSNATLKITTTAVPASNPPVYPGSVAFCTGENNQSRDDDFRIAKASPVFDSHVQRLWVENSDELAQLFAVDNTHSNRHVVYFKHPDVVECALGGAGAASLELRLLTPEGVQVAGGPSVTTFANVYTGDKGAHGEPGVAFGTNGKWIVAVQARAGAGAATYQYILACRAGSGFGGHEWVGRNQPVIP